MILLYAILCILKESIDYCKQHDLILIFLSRIRFFFKIFKGLVVLWLVLIYYLKQI